MNNFRTDLCIKNIAKGDRDALRMLYDDYKNPVFRFALSIVRNYQTSEDILQDTFLHVMSYASSYRPGTNPHAWIFSIARNLCKRALLSRDKDCQNIDDLEASLIASDRTDDILASKQAAEALSVLHEDELEIVSLYVYGELKQTEIAKVLKLPYGKVRSKYGYAMKKLKTYYTERAENL